jgi:[ribosomal protein S5]-alanine N-acetyltransferase
MTPNQILQLDRLELVAATPELLRAEDDLPRLAEALQADVPANWPTAIYDADARSHFLSLMQEHPEAAGWTVWYILRLNGSGRKILIGAVGAVGPPSEDGVIEIGYSLLDQFFGQGYATEALRGFLAWACRRADLKRIIADTSPNSPASIRVLQKNGFVRCGPGAEPETIRFELLRS